MFFINTLEQELSTAKTYEHNLLEEKSVIDRHRCTMAAKFDVLMLMRIRASFLRYTGYKKNFIKDPISHVLFANSSSCTTTEFSIISFINATPMLTSFCFSVLPFLLFCFDSLDVWNFKE